MKHPVASPEEKRVALATLPAQYENRLFYAARNLAIEAMLLRLEVLMLRGGFDVETGWRESSMYGPTIEVKLKNPKPLKSAWEFATASVTVERSTIKVPSQKASECFYSLKSVHSTEYSPYRESKYVQDFRAYFQRLADERYFLDEINKVNYPFDYKFFSSY